MKNYSSGAQALLAAGTFARRNLIWVEMPDESVGFWDDAFDAVIDERTYFATYGGIQISPRQTAADFGMRNVTISINGLDSRVHSEVLAQPYHQRPIYLSQVLISIETQQVIELTQWFAGFIDKIPRKEKLGGVAVLDVIGEGIGREFNRNGARTRSDSDQQQISPNDPFFEHTVPSNNVPQQWGTFKTQKQKTGGVAGLLDKLF